MTVPGGARLPLPALDGLTGGQLLFSALSIAAAFLLLAASGYRIATGLALWQWWTPLALLGGILSADFLSGMIHWAADTWGRDDLPVIGHRLLVPFRIHHLNPDDFLRRRFVDTNGDTAFLVVPVLLCLLAVPLDARWGGAIVIWGFGLCSMGMMTNQIHQWAHMPVPPRPVRLLQACGLFLGRPEHAAHHDGSYDAHYCITTGWCNGALEAVGFFRRLEATITRLTGAMPRHDDRMYEARYGVHASPRSIRHG